MQKRSGYILIEALVSIAILGVLIVGLLPSINFLLERSRRSAINTDANLLLQEGMEVTSNIFASDWNAYEPGTYKISIDETGSRPVWVLFPAESEPNIEAKFTRVIRISPVTRKPGSGVLGSGPDDPKSRVVTTSVTWGTGAQENTITADLLLINTK